MAAAHRKPGEFCWIDLQTTVPTKSKALFSRLFGWTFIDAPTPSGTYTVLSCGGSWIGGMTDLAKLPVGNRFHSHISIFVLTASADATANSVERCGGRVLAPPFDVGGDGRMCSFTDPTGALINVWERKSHPGTDVDPTSHGAPARIELLTNDVGRAGNFYKDAFGWGLELGEGYQEFKLGEGAIGGMTTITMGMGRIAPHWRCCMTVHKVDQTVKDCAAAGGQVVVPPRDVPGVGRCAAMESEDGIKFMAISMAT